LPAAGNSFYSFDTGPAHIIFLNPYTPSDPGTPQYQWFLSDIGAVDRARTPWVLVLTHCPLYSSNKVHYAELQAKRLRQNLEDLFYR
jgi:acid phosphatase type 7